MVVPSHQATNTYRIITLTHPSDMAPRHPGISAADPRLATKPLNPADGISLMRLCDRSMGQGGSGKKTSEKHRGIWEVGLVWRKVKCER